MTNEELSEVEVIEADLLKLNNDVENFTNGNANLLFAGNPADPVLYETQIDDFRNALIVEATSLRDAKQIEFDDFTGTDV